MGASSTRSRIQTSRRGRDGTKTSTILAESSYREGLRNVTAGANHPTSLQARHHDRCRCNRLGAEEALQEVSDRTEIHRWATVSANWEKTIGEIIADADGQLARTGTNHGSRKPKSIETTLEWSRAFSSTRVNLSPYFVTRGRSMEAFSRTRTSLLREENLGI